MKMWVTRGLAVVFVIFATTACAGNKHQGKKTMHEKNDIPTITIPNKTVGRSGDYKIAVGYILENGTYKDSKGLQRKGTMASLSIFQGDTPDQRPMIVHVGEGSSFKLGKTLFKVLNVVYGPNGKGWIDLQPLR